MLLDQKKSANSTVPDLPVLAYKNQIKQSIAEHPITIIVGETGSGKTTEIGHMMLEVIGGKIGITQPRRPAAVSVAEYVAAQRGQSVGQDVGYHIRFQDTTNLGTSLDYLTDGILIQQILATQTLPVYSGLVLDEAHIRNLNGDFLMGLILEVNRRRQQYNLPALKVVIASATIPAKQFSDFFGQAPIINIPGRMYPVEVVWDQRVPTDYVLAVSRKICAVIDQGLSGDILAFVPGEAEIRGVIGHLSSLDLPDLEILPFYGQQSLAQQEKVFQTYAKRKVVVATNIAETSLTIHGVRIVIDSGLQRVSLYDPVSGISYLVDEYASLAAIKQRKGRAGRTDTGICFRLYPKNLLRSKYDTPEILRTDLAGVVLKLKRMGVDDPQKFAFIQSPDKIKLDRAIHSLQILGALDKQECLTDIGRTMAELPLDPHLARMVVEAERRNCLDQVCILAAFMSSKSVFLRPPEEQTQADKAHNRFRKPLDSQPHSDIYTYLNIWSQACAHDFDPDWLKSNYLSPKTLQEIVLIREDLLKTLGQDPAITNKGFDSIAVAKSVLAGNAGRLLRRSRLNRYRQVFGSQDNISVHPSSALRLAKLPEYILAGEIAANVQGYISAFHCQPVEVAWLAEVAPGLLLQNPSTPMYDPKTDRVQVFVGYSLPSEKLLLRPIPQSLPSSQAAAVFADYLATGMYKGFSRDSGLIGSMSSWVSHVRYLKTELQAWHMRSRGRVSELSPKWFGQVLRQVLQTNQISDMADFQTKLVRQAPADVLPISLFLPGEAQAEIVETYPDSLYILEQQFPVTYTKYKRRFRAYIQLEADLILKIEQAPAIPNYPPSDLYIRILSKYHKRSEHPSNRLPELKQEALREVLAATWRQAVSQGLLPSKPLPVTSMPQISDFPTDIVYGNHPLTARPLVAKAVPVTDVRKKIVGFRYLPDSNH